MIKSVETSVSKPKILSPEEMSYTDGYATKKYLYPSRPYSTPQSSVKDVVKPDQCATIKKVLVIRQVTMTTAP